MSEAEGYLGPGGEETPPVDDCEDGRGVNSTKGLQRSHHHHGCVKMNYENNKKSDVYCHRAGGEVYSRSF